MKFLTKKLIGEIIDHFENYLDANDFDNFYIELQAYLRSNGRNNVAEIVGEFTEFLLNSGIDPLIYMSAVPNYYLYGVSNTTDVVIPKNIKTIMTKAFGGSTLEHIKFEGAPNIIAPSAFFNTDLTGDLVLPEGVKDVLDHAFYFTALNSLTLPNSIEYIGEEIVGKNCKIYFNGTEDEWFDRVTIQSQSRTDQIQYVEFLK